ncbi:MAG: hypothetical protein Q8R32_02205 [bacterium]|nr:hypothetical protein [bacterium]
MTFSTTKPDGSPRRDNDNREAHENSHFHATTRFVTGLERTIAWY